MGLTIIDRKTGKIEEEKIYGEKYLHFLYGKYGKLLLPIICRSSLFSRFYGWLQKRSSSKKKVQPFIDTYHVNTKEFEKKPQQFCSFNDFFVRKLKEEARSIVSDQNIAVLPADGRYLTYEKIEACPFFTVKGQEFSLETFLQSEGLADQYLGGSLMLARLCPTDYHRFHFPFDCTLGETKLINGFLYSVNPLALKKRAGILLQNKRFVTPLQSKEFGKVLFVEIGATNVGSVSQTFKGSSCKKGDEKGYFSFGGSAIAMIFQKDKIIFDEDLVSATKKGIEVKAEFGQSLGKVFDG